MIGFRLKRFFVKTLGLGPAAPKPLFDGPPENPEYYILSAKPGAKYADRGPAVYQLVDEAEAQRLRQLRFAHYLEQVPEKKGLVTDKAEALQSHDAMVDPDHVPKSCVFRKKVSLTSNTFTPLSVIYGMDCPFVRPAFKEAVEAVAPGLMQFFPYECRLASGEVFARLYLMHWSRRGRDPIDKARSGIGPIVYGGVLAERAQRGQVVIRRSLLDGSALQIFGFAHEAIYSKQLADRLGPALGRNEQFYPVHVYDGL